jgi:transposase
MTCLQVSQLEYISKDFGTIIVDLLALSDWLAPTGETHIVIENTGKYYKALFIILQATFIVFPVNGAHISRYRGASRQDRWT